MTLRSAIGRRGPAVAGMALGAVVVVVGSLLPWVRTGDRRRNSYDVFTLVERLGFSPGGLAARGLQWWPLVPLLTAIAVVAAWWGWPRSGAAVGVVAALYGGVVGCVVATADPPSLVHIQSGATTTAVGGAILLVSSIACAIVAARHDRSALRR